MAQLNFNANDHEPNQPMGPIPEGTYLVAITESEMKPAKSGAGQYLALSLVVQEGDYKGRKVYANLNINHTNVEATRIARGDLSAICRAVNVMTPRDTIELHNLPFMVDVTCRKYKKPDGSDAMSNDVKNFRSKHRTEPVQPEPAAAAQRSAPWAG